VANISSKKKASLDNLIHEYIVIGTEPWLKPTVEIFSPNFVVFRQDRMDGYGGIFLSCCSSYNWENLPLDTSDNNVEAVAYKLKMKSTMFKY